MKWTPTSLNVGRDHRNYQQFELKYGNFDTNKTNLRHKAGNATPHESPNRQSEGSREEGIASDVKA